MMTPQEAYQEFFDNAFHRTMKPQISEDAKMIAIMALVEKIEREEKDQAKKMLTIRSMWEPCKTCRSCDNCKNNSDYSPDEGIYGECGQCHEYSNFEPRNFCGECGRPLTNEAWSIIEKRIR